MADRDWSPYPHVTDILTAMVPIDTRWFTDFARDRGTAVHRATELYDQGTLDPTTVGPEVAGRLRAYERFHAECNPDIMTIEERVENHGMRYCGTLDRRMLLDHVEHVIDIKPPGEHPWHRLQVAAYAACYQTRLHRAVLHLHDDGSYRLRRYLADREDEKVWYAMVRLYYWREMTK